MVNPALWLELIAWTKAAFEAIKAGGDATEIYKKYRRDKATIQESERVSVRFSTYSDEEIEATLRRFHGCRERFIQQGGGADRSRCICSVLNELAEGNGGTLPPIDNFQEIYNQLGCSRTR